MRSFNTSATFLQSSAPERRIKADPSKHFSLPISPVDPVVVNVVDAVEVTEVVIDLLADELIVDDADVIAVDDKLLDAVLDTVLETLELAVLKSQFEKSPSML